MNTVIRSLLLGGSVLIAGPRASADPAKPAPVRGAVLVLDEERVLEGDVELVGDRYRIRRSVGETWLPARSALALCADMKGAYEFLRGRANLRDADERLRLARWCHQRGLREEAVAEAAAAVELRPRHAATRDYLAGLRRALEAARTAPPATPVATAAPPEPPPAAEVNAEAFKLFVAKVQPILMNACATCHAGGKGGEFRLLRAYEGSLGNRKATTYNLAAAAAQITRDRLAASPLLVKAVAVHGDAAQAPIKGTNHPAYKALELWVQEVSGEPVAPPMPAVVTAPGGTGGFAAPEAGEPMPEADPTPRPPLPPMPTEPGRAAPVVPISSPPAGVPGQPAVLPAPPPAAPPPARPGASPAPSDDPFDPQIFNRRAHPDRVPPAGPMK